MSPAPAINIDCSNSVPFPSFFKSFICPNSFFFLNNLHSFSEWNETGQDKLWLYNLHYFDWLRQKNISEDEGNRWIEKWIEDNPPPTGNGWEPYPISLRIVNWIKWHLCGHELSNEAKNSLAVQVRYLQKRLEYHLLANHLLANAKALVFAGLFFDGAEAKLWLKNGIEIYQQQLPEQILLDGGHFELSPMYHSIILEDLLDLKNIIAPLALDDYIERMTYWLSVMTGPDGKIALFNDAAHGIALDPQIIQDYAKSLGIKTKAFKTPVLLPNSGYVRLSNGDLTLIVDCGEIGPSYQPGHAHADALSFEVWKGEKKIITNGGTCHYYDSPERKYQRSSAAHNTAVIDNRNSSEVWRAHRVARRGHVVHREIESPSVLSASFQTFTGTTHTRKWIIPDSSKIIIEDQIDGKNTKTYHLTLYYHFLEDSIGISIKPAMESRRMETSYSPRFGQLETRETAVFSNNVKSSDTIRTIIQIGKKQ